MNKLNTRILLEYYLMTRILVLVTKNENLEASCFPKLIPAACKFKNNARERYLFVSDLSFCHLHVIYLPPLSSVAIEAIGKIKQNELDCHDTDPLNWGSFE